PGSLALAQCAIQFVGVRKPVLGLAFDQVVAVVGAGQRAAARLGGWQAGDAAKVVIGDAAAEQPICGVIAVALRGSRRARIAGAADARLAGDQRGAIGVGVIAVGAGRAATALRGVFDQRQPARFVIGVELA